ncbi:tyrosine-type recombinase/integrase [Bacillus toyonensis]|uniref:tyrosine-type recombinase/integrase n=1 Tax=Bacillus toyonensis TaxID=155322 RepID=UPI0035A8C689
MNFVQPIRDPEQIQQLKEFFKEKSLRNYILFIMGINTGLRISDILKLKVGDVKGSHISMREKKTGKQKRIQITAALKRELKRLIEEREDNEYLLQSRQGKNRPIGRSMAYKILSGAAGEFGLDEIGTHTLLFLFKSRGIVAFWKNPTLRACKILYCFSAHSVTKENTKTAPG